MDNPTLHDIARLLVQADADNPEHLRLLLASLDTLLAGSGVSVRVGERLTQARNAVAECVDGDAMALTVAGMFIETAQQVAETEAEEPLPSSATPAPAAAAAPAAPAHMEVFPPEEVLPADLDAGMMADFITESRDNIGFAEGSLLTLETNPDDKEAINTIFRAFHTMKGMAAFLGFRMVSELAHHTESFLSRVREGEIRYTPAYADLALASVDLMKELVQGIQDALGGSPVRKPEAFDGQMHKLRNLDLVAGAATVPAGRAQRLGDILVAEGTATAEEIEAVAASKGDAPIGEALVRAQVASASEVGQALRQQQGKPEAAATATAEATTRVRTDRLDRLVNLVGELVIAQSMLDADPTATDGQHYELLRKVEQSAKIVRELQTLGMAMRLVPLRQTFQKMQRLVRDLSRKSGKNIGFVTSGEDTEIDRNMVEAINDVLVHMVRNSCDHGVEAPDVRTQRGKPEAGTVKLSAYHAGGNVVFEIEDDGAGLDRGRILAKARKNGMVAADEEPSDDAVNLLIFAAGFSTAEVVSDVSGRGVGMDVVKRAIEGLRGLIEIRNRPGQGCTFIIRVPLTMAITDGMVVRVADQRYVVPLLAIRTTLKPEPDMLSTIAGRGEMVRFQDELIPVVRLHRHFGLPGACEALTDGLLMLINEGQANFAILVDELLGQVQVVAKSLGEGIGKVDGVSGGAILGDGNVGLILDPRALAPQQDR